MRTISATTIPYSRVQTKADLIKALDEKFNADVMVTDIELGHGACGILEMPGGFKMKISNPQRSWFAVIERVDGETRLVS